MDQTLEGSDHAAVVFEMSSSGHPAECVVDSKAADEPTSGASASLADPSPDEMLNRVTAALAPLGGSADSSIMRLKCGPGDVSTGSNSYYSCLSSLEEV